MYMLTERTNYAGVAYFTLHQRPTNVPSDWYSPVSPDGPAWLALRSTGRNDFAVIDDGHPVTHSGDN
jgi:hypothetical protein